ncbi:hypothetical protein ACW0JT_20250 [Arthrobacter sp. SA17]
MKGMGKLKPTGFALLAAATLFATAACTPRLPVTAPPRALRLEPHRHINRIAYCDSIRSGLTESLGFGVTIGNGRSACGRFSSKLLPLMPGAKVVSSSFDKTGTPATAAMVGSVGAPAADVLAFYTKELEAQGFKAVPGESVETVASKDFLRGENETINVAVVHNGGVSTFTIGANVSPESAK